MSAGNKTEMASGDETTGSPGLSLRIGWASADITPASTVAIRGQFHVRISEGVADPLTATALAIESDGGAVVFVSCDLISISEALRDAVRERVAGLIPGTSLVMNGTHTHCAPGTHVPDRILPLLESIGGFDYPRMSSEEYVEFASGRIASAVEQAWNSRAPGKIAYGLGHAVVGRNRRAVYADGSAVMYGDTNSARFSHVEGYEDHSVNVLATYDRAGDLTGVVVNVPCPSQIDEHRFEISADYWHDTRAELRRRLGDDLFVLSQCSAAGDQSPRPPYDKAAEKRMRQLAGQDQRRAVAVEISDAVSKVLAVVEPTASGDLTVEHHAQQLELPLAQPDEGQVADALAEAEAWAARFEEERNKLEQNPELRDEPRWYVDITRAARRCAWYRRVAERLERRKEQPTQPVEVHVVRLGDVVIATNPFEYYLDFGVYIKARSKAVQTFLVQLAGPGTYVPSPRSTTGGGYGSVPASNPFGPDAGQLLAEKTVEVIDRLFRTT